jgi:hypothetical protein
MSQDEVDAAVEELYQAIRARLPKADANRPAAPAPSPQQPEMRMRDDPLTKQVLELFPELTGDDAAESH